MTDNKKCRVGYSCKLTCISRRNDCLSELSPEVQKVLLEKLEKNQINIMESTNVDYEKLGKTIVYLGKFLGKNPRGGISWENTEYGLTRVLSLEEIRELKNKKSVISKAEYSEEERINFIQDVKKYRNLEVSDNFSQEEIRILYDILPTKAQNQLKRSGSAPAGEWYGGTRTASKARGLEILGLYLSQGGKDAYSESDKVFSPVDLDVEHIVPLSRGGKDEPNNWVLIRAGVNRERKDIPYEKWIDSLPDSEKGYGEYVKKKAERKAERETAASSIGNISSVKNLDSEKILRMSSTRPLANAFKIMRFSDVHKPKEGRKVTTTPAPLVKLMLAEAALTGGELKSSGWLTSFYKDVYSSKNKEELKNLITSSFANEELRNKDGYNEAVDKAVTVIGKSLWK